MFSPDSKFMEIIGRITDLILLNILFLITCLPVFTIGASVTALYTLCFRLMREEYSGIIKSYFKAFKDNFKQATVIWLLLLAAGIPALYYFSLLFQMDGILRYSSFVFVIIAVLALMAGSYVFPWISQFENTAVQALTNALTARSGIPATQPMAAQISTARSAKDLTRAIYALQKCIEYAQCNVSTGAICGYLLWELR